MQIRHISVLAGCVVLLWLIRSVFTHSLTYGFIPTNIFLAAVPLLLEFPFSLTRNHLHGIYKRISQFVLGVLWLLFLPNAFYIITDFMHLNANVLVNQRGDNYRHGVYYGRGDGLYIFDSLLLFLAVTFGAYVGGVALVHAYVYIRKRFDVIPSTSMFGALLLLPAIGVYIGRFSRWNSWEGLIHPYRILSEIAYDLANPMKRERLVVLIVTVLVLEALSFLYVQNYYKLINKTQY